MNSSCDALVRLPSLPVVAVEILQAFHQPDTAVLDIARLVQTDPALAARILETANSTRFNPRRVLISSIDRAILLLGKRVVCGLALSFTLAEEALTRGRQSARFREFWLQSFVRATTAQWLAQRFRDFPPEDAYAIALLSMIGRLVLLKNSLEDFADCLDEAARRGVNVEVVERERSPITSHDLTCMLFERWQFPPEVVRVIAQHGQTAASPGDTTGTSPLAGILAIAETMGEYVVSPLRDPTLNRLHELFERQGRHAPNTVSEMLSGVLEHLDANLDLFRLDPRDFGPLEELLSAALEQSAELALADSAAENAQLTATSVILQENRRLKRRIERLLAQSEDRPKPPMPPTSVALAGT